LALETTSSLSIRIVHFGSVGIAEHQEIASVGTADTGRFFFRPCGAGGILDLVSRG
jgi:hypothetical protein